MNKKQQRTTGQLSKGERLTLIIATIINGTFAVVVAVLASSLLIYALPHLIIAAFALVYLTGKGKSETWKRLVILISIMAAIAAIWLTFAYLPWYMTYLRIR